MLLMLIPLCQCRLCGNTLGGGLQPNWRLFVRAISQPWTKQAHVYLYCAQIYLSCQVSGVAGAGTQINPCIDFDWWPKCCFVWAGRRTRTTKSFRCTSCSITKRSKQHASGGWKFPSAPTSQGQTDTDTRNFTGATRNLLKLGNVLSLCHLVVIFAHTASVSLTAFSLFFST